MTATAFLVAFEGIETPTVGNPNTPIYAVRPVPGYESYFVGKDAEGHACILIRPAGTGKGRAPIRLENLDVQFDLACQIKKQHEPQQSATFTVVRCRVDDTETVRYFLSICETILRILGDKPGPQDISIAVNRLAAILQKLQKPASRPINGLFGELYSIWRSPNPVRALSAWRADDAECFDFCDGDLRLEVKSATGKIRIHTFSYEQVTPPPAVTAIVISLFVAQAGGGTSLQSVVDSIETRVAAHADIVLKLHEVVAGTLGSSVNEALRTRFDIRVTDASLKFFDALAIPAIRGPLPPNVTDVHFRADLSAQPELSASDLSKGNPLLTDLLPCAA